jgi:hypothetical protein
MKQAYLPPITTIDQCLHEAQGFINQQRKLSPNTRSERYLQVFTALADNNPTAGLLAYYIWRRGTRRRM